MAPTFTALVPAAGRGLRFGQGSLKQWAAVAGRPVLVWTVERLLRCGASRVFVAVPPDSLAEARRVLALDRVEPLQGGPTRQESVRRCLARAETTGDALIAIHDGVRPAVSEADFRTTLDAAARTGAAILGRPVHDTLKRVEFGRVTATADRSCFFRAETPQVFRRDVLERAYAAAEADGFQGTDEASLVERLGDVEIRAVEARDPNPKLTRQDQLALLESLLS